MRVVCPVCGEVADVDDRLKGKKGRCRCGNVFQINETGLLTANVFKPSDSIQSRKSVKWLPIIASVLAPVAIIASVLLVAYAAGNSSKSAKEVLLATSEKFDGREAARLRFWVDHREAGHGSWAELDLRVDSQSVFGPMLLVSSETKQAYRKWRTAAIGRAPAKDTRKAAKLRLDRVVRALEEKDGYAMQWIAEVEAGTRDPSNMEALLRTVNCSAETIMAFRTWVDVAVAEAK